jgi:hypothetical protein
MAVTKIGQLIDSQSYSDTLDGRFSGSFTNMYQSTLTGADAMSDIITYIEGTENIKLGKQISNPPFDKMIVTGRSITPVSGDDKNTFIVAVTFGQKEKKTIATAADWVFKFSSTLSQTETNQDTYGTYTEVGTLAGSDATPSGGPFTAVPQVTATLSKMYPAIRITASGQLDANPWGDYIDKVGTLNSAAMSVDGQTLAIGTTMLVSANVRTPNDGDFYLVDYEFEYREDPNDWYVVATAVNPKTGQPWQNIKEIQYKTAAATYSPASATGVEKGAVGFMLYGSTDIGSLIS